MKRSIGQSVRLAAGVCVLLLVAAVCEGVEPEKKVVSPVPGIQRNPVAEREAPIRTTQPGERSRPKGVVSKASMAQQKEEGDGPNVQEAGEESGKEKAEKNPAPATSAETPEAGQKNSNEKNSAEKSGQGSGGTRSMTQEELKRIINAEIDARLADLELQVKQLEEKLKKAEKTLIDEVAAGKLTQGQVAGIVKDIESLRETSRDLNRAVNSVATKSGQDWVPNVLSKMSNEAAREEHYRSVQGHLVVHNRTNEDQTFWVNGGRWTLKPGANDLPVPLGELVVNLTDEDPAVLKASRWKFQNDEFIQELWISLPKEEKSSSEKSGSQQK